MKFLLVIGFVIFVTCSAFDIISLKTQFCNVLKSHWAYERLNLKHRCLEMVKQLGPKLCLDVIKNILYFVKIYYVMVSDTK